MHHFRLVSNACCQRKNEWFQNVTAYIQHTYNRILGFKLHIWFHSVFHKYFLIGGNFFDCKCHTQRSEIWRLSNRSLASYWLLLFHSLYFMFKLDNLCVLLGAFFQIRRYNIYCTLYFAEYSCFSRYSVFVYSDFYSYHQRRIELLFD